MIADTITGMVGPPLPATAACTGKSQLQTVAGQSPNGTQTRSTVHPAQ